MSQQLPDTEGYSPSKGLFSARKAIMQYAQLKNIPNVSIDDIYTGNGVSELINLSLSALLDNGDEVLVPSPDYPLWTACVNLAGGTAVHYVCDEDSEWYPDIDDMRSKITDQGDRHHQSEQSDRRAVSEGSASADCRSCARAPAHDLLG